MTATRTRLLRVEFSPSGNTGMPGLTPEFPMVNWLEGTSGDLLRLRAGPQYIMYAQILYIYIYIYTTFRFLVTL